MSFALHSDLDNYAVFGYPIGHSKSPQIHTLFARQTGQAIFYQAIEVMPGSFSDMLAKFKDAGGKGLNVTLPFKREAYAICDKLSSRAEEAGAVNTIWFDDVGQYHGDITDGIGLVCDLEQNQGVVVRGQDILILGAGGAARGILGALCACAPKQIVIANRTLCRAQTLVETYHTDITLSALPFSALSGSRFGLILNATSASLRGQLPPLPNGLIAEGGCCYDLTYASTSTPFVRWGEAQGANTAIDGLGMLVEQAAISFSLWRGMRPETVPVIRQLQTENTI